MTERVDTLVVVSGSTTISTPVPVPIPADLATAIAAVAAAVGRAEAAADTAEEAAATITAPDWSAIRSKPTTIVGFGITDAPATVRGVVLTGLSTATSAVIAATDTVLAAFGKLQAQITANLATLTGHTG